MMDNILSNSSKYADLARQYEFDRTRWDKDKIQCLIGLKNAIETFSVGKGYSIELSGGKEPCININPDVQSGRIRKRTAGVYVAPTKGMVSIVLNMNTYVNLKNKYELPDCKLKNNQYSCSIDFCELCSFVEAIISL